MPASAAGKPKQYLGTLFHRVAPRQRPPCDDRPGPLPEAERLSSPDQVQDFIPAPFDIATCTVLTPASIPFTGRGGVHVAKGISATGRLQRALLQFFKPENYFMVREALLKAGRQDLIGSGCDCLIPSQPPKAALEARRRQANDVAEGDHYHSMANPAKGEPAGERGLPNQGYRPDRKTAKRRQRKK